MRNLTENKYFNYLLGAVLLALIIFALHWCNSKPQPINEPAQETDQLNEIILDKEAIILATMENNKVLRDSLFMLLQRKPVVVIRKIKVYDSLLVEDTACIRSLVTLYNQCANVDSVNEYIIGNQSAQISQLISVTNNQQDIIDIRNYQHGVDSVNYEVLKEQIPVEYKRGLRKGRRQGIVIGKVGEVVKDGLYLYFKK